MKPLHLCLYCKETKKSANWLKCNSSYVCQNCVRPLLIKYISNSSYEVSNSSYELTPELIHMNSELTRLLSLLGEKDILIANRDQTIDEYAVELELLKKELKRKTRT